MAKLTKLPLCPTKVFLTILLSFFSATAIAETLLQILPTRVVLDSQRSTTLTLINRGDEDGTYRIFMRNIRTNEKGEFSEIDTPIEGELFSDKMIRFSPRRVTVPAGQKQTIKIVVRKPKNLADGEYRSHMVFRKLPAQDSVLNESNEEDIAFSFKPIVEVTMPIIVRHGKVSAKPTISSAKLINDSANNQQLIEVSLKRSGNRSIYGDLSVWWKKDNTEDRRIAYGKGVTVYVPNSQRKVLLEINSEKTITEGSLRIEYHEDPAYGGNTSTTYEKEISLK